MSNMERIYLNLIPNLRIISVNKDAIILVQAALENVTMRHTS